MITAAVLDIVFSFVFRLFDKFLLYVNIPALSDEVMSNLYDYLHLFDYAAQFIGFFVPMNVFNYCLSAVFLLFVAEHLYPFLMWIIRKIPVSIN